MAAGTEAQAAGTEAQAADTMTWAASTVAWAVVVAMVIDTVVEVFIAISLAAVFAVLEAL